MSLVAEVLKWVLLVLGVAAVVAFVIHNIRSETSAAKRKAPLKHGRPVSPNALVNQLIRDFGKGPVLFCRIQTPQAKDHIRIRDLIEKQGVPDSSHFAVENGVVISCYLNAEDRAEQLAKETMSVLKENGISEGACLFSNMQLEAEPVLTWILRGDNRHPTGPLRLEVDTGHDSID